MILYYHLENCFKSNILSRVPVAKIIWLPSIRIKHWIKFYVNGKSNECFEHLNCHHPKNICFKSLLLKLVISLLSDLIQVNKGKFRDWFLRITVYLWCIFHALTLVFSIWWMFILMPAYKYVWPYLYKKIIFMRSPDPCWYYQ